MWRRPPVKRRERISAIQAICDGEFPEIEREAIAGGWTPEVVTKKVLETIRAERPAANVTAPEGGELRKTIEAAMCLRVGVSADQLEKSYGAKTVEAGMAEMDMPLKQLLIECMKLDGIPYSRGFDNETIRAAFSSVSLPGILSNVANKKLLQSYEAQPIIAMKLCWRPQRLQGERPLPPDGCGRSASDCRRRRDQGRRIDRREREKPA